MLAPDDWAPRTPLIGGWRAAIGPCVASDEALGEWGVVGSDCRVRMTVHHVGPFANEAGVSREAEADKRSGG